MGDRNAPAWEGENEGVAAAGVAFQQHREAAPGVGTVAKAKAVHSSTIMAPEPESARKAT